MNEKVWEMLYKEEKVSEMLKSMIKEEDMRK
jgi:hypothetical protein